ncbi:hypothetical protein A33Q_4589 [Indibacter alkaliphilus LW1]|uniref:6-bladed beta-propeller protein n=2 Tax=Indibacter TaxID=647744 RepID=S2DHI3_INDAL|nr:hypothetical protein A33Q_4589 [Indibacter alkaliphilus LW1]
MPKEIAAGFFDKVLVTEDHYIFADYDMSQKIFVLDKEFKLVSTISKYGEGPGEYQLMMAVDYNEEMEAIEILTQKNILRYSTDGKYIESVKVPFTFGSFIHYSGDDYLIYNKNPQESTNENKSSFALWNSKSNKFSSIVTHETNELAGSFMERSNFYKFNNEIFATQIFLDTLYKIGKSNQVTRYYLNFDNKNLPYEYVKFDSKGSIQSILDNEEFMKDYAFHYPTLLISDHFLIDRYIKDNIFYFFILNKGNGKVLSGDSFVNDIDSGTNYLRPLFIDNSNNLYTIHQYEELKRLTNDSSNENSRFSKFVNSLDPETGFVVVQYTLKDF